jgi:hypothetical protein
MHGFEDAFQLVQGADRHQDMRGIGPLNPTRLHPAPRVAGGQEGIKVPLASRMGQQAAAKIVQQHEVEAWVGSLKAEGILPIHAAADGIGRLAVGQPFDILNHHDQG